ncbi:MAG: hypothetical protein ACKO91_05605 [Acidimicrobiales bacterium]
MAAPKFVPVPPTDRARGYESPDHVPDSWRPDRPAEIRGRQPQGSRLGFQGPDQGFGIRIAESFRSKVQTGSGESVDDALRGALLIGLRRASLFGRAPVVHDLSIALTIWGWLDPAPPAELITARRSAFAGVANTAHHYEHGRALVDQVPEATLRMTPQQVAAAYPGRWQELTGAH